MAFVLSSPLLSQLYFLSLPDPLHSSLPNALLLTTKRTSFLFTCLILDGFAGACSFFFSLFYLPSALAFLFTLRVAYVCDT